MCAERQKSWKLYSKVVFAILTVGCASPAVLRFPQPLSDVSLTTPTIAPSQRTQQLLALAAQHQQSSGDFSAVLSVSMRDLSRGQSFSAQGAVAVHRPDRLRLQLTGPGGITFLDMIVRDGSRWVRWPGRSWERSEIDAPNSFGPPLGTLAQMFLGMTWTDAQVVRDAALTVARTQQNSPNAVWDTMLLAFDASDGALREARWFLHSHEFARARFASFTRETDSVRYPGTVLFWQASPEIITTVTVHSRTIHPQLPSEAFNPPNGS